jgi:hypothetical protein
MLHRTKLTVAQLFNNPNGIRTILVLSALAIAVLTGAAPHGMD